jgi:hypothetical protein
VISQQRVTAYGIFTALTTPFGIAVHLIAELAALGYQDDALLIFSSKHCYLAALAALSFASLIRLIGSIPKSERRRIAAQIIADLPFARQGLSFYTFSFSVQLGFFLITQVGEGEPIACGNVSVALVAAATASAMGAIALSFCKMPILRVIIEMYSLLAVHVCNVSTSSVKQRINVRFHIQLISASTLVFSSRPPPYGLSS